MRRGSNYYNSPNGYFPSRSAPQSNRHQLRESPDLYCISPASILNQRQYCSNPKDYDSSTRQTTNMQDFSVGLMRSIENSKIQSRNGLAVNTSLLRIDTDKLNNSWSSIYHSQINSNFRYMDSRSPSLNRPLSSLVLSKSYELERNSHNHHKLSKAKYGHESLLPMLSKKTKFIKPKNTKKKEKSKPVINQSFDFPAVRVSLKPGPIVEEEITQEEIRQSFKNKTKAVKLHPDDINRLHLNTQYAATARQFYFYPNYFSMAPLLIESKKSQLSKPE